MCGEIAFMFSFRLIGIKQKDFSHVVLHAADIWWRKSKCHNSFVIICILVHYEYTRIHSNLCVMKLLVVDCVSRAEIHLQSSAALKNNFLSMHQRLWVVYTCLGRPDVHSSRCLNWCAMYCQWRKHSYLTRMSNVVMTPLKRTMIIFKHFIPAVSRSHLNICDLAFLGAFTKWRKATISFVMSVRMEQLGSHWTDFDETWYFNFFFF